ncbi:hypothetical protein [Ktedonobacter racemifer]|uniref:Uncharacterized protein n=1 Tax=Ktedonobacter racemifer DSM 44963 TaxID=485913 RepID=D6U8Y6_KTERA|nr:hypothetical protein [Ktedonobacter racemifer]EFH79541.1 hypothetical protein Krac_0051 [Ktedonobacter racemifer DSM 44963]
MDETEKSRYEKEGYMSGMSIAYHNWWQHRFIRGMFIILPVDVLCRHNYDKRYSTPAHYEEFRKGFHDAAVSTYQGLMDGRIDSRQLYTALSEMFEVPEP